jgi:thiol-disulfide isomerase/thioredoxin
VSKTKNKKQGASAPSSLYFIAALLAAIAGFGTIYWSLAPSGNDSSEHAQSSASGSATDKTSATPDKSAASNPLNGLNKGEMAGLVLRPKPLDVPPIKIDGGAKGPMSIDSFKGKVVLLNVWATWCHPCRGEMPDLDKLQAQLGGKNFEVVALNIDRGGIDAPKKFLAETGATHLGLFHDPSGNAFSDLRVVGMPTTLLLNRNGKEIGRMIGPAKWDSPDAVRLIKAAIAEGQTTAGGAKPSAATETN